jgi:hypothetical protein
MKRVNQTADQLRREYRREDFDKMVRGKYAKRYKESSNVVVIAPDIAKAFPNEQSVNDALRGLLKLAKRAGSTKR